MFFFSVHLTKSDCAALSPSTRSISIRVFSGKPQRMLYKCKKDANGVSAPVLRFIAIDYDHYTTERTAKHTPRPRGGLEKASNRYFPHAGHILRRKYQHNAQNNIWLINKSTKRVILSFYVFTNQNKLEKTMIWWFMRCLAFIHEFGLRPELWLLTFLGEVRAADADEPAPDRLKYFHKQNTRPLSLETLPAAAQWTVFHAEHVFISAF